MTAAADRFASLFGECRSPAGDRDVTNLPPVDEALIRAFALGRPLPEGSTLRVADTVLHPGQVGDYVASLAVNRAAPAALRHRDGTVLIRGNVPDGQPLRTVVDAAVCVCEEYAVAWSWAPFAELVDVHAALGGTL